MLIVSGHLTLTPGRRDAFLAAAIDVMTEARAAPGCLDFVLAGDPLDADRVNIFERWESTADLLAFRGDGPGGDDMADVIGGDVFRYEISSVGPA